MIKIAFSEAQSFKGCLLLESLGSHEALASKPSYYCAAHATISEGAFLELPAEGGGLPGELKLRATTMELGNTAEIISQLKIGWLSLSRGENEI